MEKRSISSYLKAWVRALSIEINYMKKHGGEKYTVGKGEYLGQQGDAYLYRFERTADLYLFDGAQVRLVDEHKESKGEVIGREGIVLFVIRSIRLRTLFMKCCCARVITVLLIFGGLLEREKHIRCPKSRQAITGNQSGFFYYLTVMQRWTVYCKKLHVS